MGFDDIKDRLAEFFAAVYSRLQENESFIQLQDRYYAQPPSRQKGILAGAVALLALIIFAIPWGIYSSSAEKISEFEEKKGLIQELFRVKRESAGLAGAPRTIPPTELIGMVQNQLASARLSPEQIKGVQQYDNAAGGKPSAAIPKSVVQEGVAVTIGKLNLRQLVDIGYGLQTLAAGVKMVAMDVQAAADDPRYFDVTYKLVAFSVREAPAPPPGNARKGKAPGGAGNNGG